MSFYAAGALFNMVTSLFLGAFTFFKNSKGPVNRGYGLLSLSLAFWSANYFLWQTAGTYGQALLFVRLLTIGSVFIPTSFLYFILCLLKKQRKKSRLVFIGFAVSALFTTLVTSPFFIPGLFPKMTFAFWPDAGFLYTAFLVFFFFCVLYAISLLWKAYRKATGYKKAQLWYVLAASVVGFLGGSTNYPLWYNIRILPVLNLLVGVHVLILAYAIVKFRLMDITVVVTRATIFLGVYALVLGLPFVLSTSGKFWLMDMFGANWWLGPLVLMGTLGTLGPFVYLYLKNKAEAVLLREQRACKHALQNAAVDMSRIRNLQQLLDFVCSTIAGSGIISSAIYFFDSKTGEYVLKASVGFPEDMAGRIDPGASYLAARMQKHKEPVIREEVKRMIEEHASAAYKGMENELGMLGAAMAVPCFLQDKLTEIIILGEKKTGKIYLQEDVDNFSSLSREIALATENALLYDKIENEVKERTSELVETQKQLVQAEKLATVGTLAGGVAHEINNPLTAIMTNVQMLLTSDIKFDEDTKESLELMEEATKRCRSIVQKLMTYAKKPMGPEEIKKVNLVEVVKGVKAFLGYQLQQENIHLVISATADEYWVKGNHNELEQVVTNLVINAKDAVKKVKKSDNIYIRLYDVRDCAFIDVRDEGSGIPKDVLHKIFDPFFTTKEIGKGVGLGLSICQSIMEKHGGSISVKSELNQGSTFTMKLPKAA